MAHWEMGHWGIGALGHWGIGGIGARALGRLRTLIRCSPLTSRVYALNHWEASPSPKVSPSSATECDASGKGTLSSFAGAPAGSQKWPFLPLTTKKGSLVM